MQADERRKGIGFSGGAHDMKTALRLLLCAAMLLCLAGCVRKADISAYGDALITVSGLLDEDFTVTPNELAALECVSRTAVGATAKAGTVRAYGPLLDTFLARYGYSASDFYKIRFLCADEYKVVLRDEYLTDYEIVMAVAYRDGPLPEEMRPLRLLIPEAESSKWAYAVTRIEFERTP